MKTETSDTARIILVDFNEGLGAIGPADNGTKLLVVGDSDEDNTNFTLGKLDFQGAPDSSFGDGKGFIKDSIPFAEPALFFALTICQQDDDKIFVSGVLLLLDELEIYPVAARYLATGEPDAAFGDNGKKVIIHSSNRKHDKKAWSSRQLRRASLSQTSTSAVLPDGGYLIASADTGFLTRLKANGELDTSFQQGGFLVPEPPGMPDFALTNVTLLNDAFIVTGNSGSKGGVARYTLDGNIDQSFAEGAGAAWIEAPGAAVTRLNGVSADAQGKLDVVGFASILGRTQALVTRLEPSGIADGAFNSGTPVLLALDGRESDFRYVSARNDAGSAQRVYAVGQSNFALTDNRYVAAAFTANGDSATEFGENGSVIGEPTAASTSMFLDMRSNLVIGGRINRGAGYKGMVAIQPTAKKPRQSV